MTAAAEKIAALLRLASSPAATPAEQETARSIASRLAEREESGPRAAPPPARPSAASSGRAEWRGNVECWVGPPPTHGRVCFQGPGGCVECNAIERWRRWLRGGLSA